MNISCNTRLAILLSCSILCITSVRLQDTALAHAQLLPLPKLQKTAEDYFVEAISLPSRDLGVDLLTKSIRLNPNSAAAYYQRGIFRFKDDRKLAIKDFNNNSPDNF